MSYQTIDTRDWHNQYEDGTDLDRAMTDACFDAAMNALHDYGFKGSTSDLAEEVVASLYRYISKSRDEQKRKPYVAPLLNPDHPRICANQTEDEIAYQVAKQTLDAK